ncbi:MAG: hypothetical protein II093_09315, partial [Selenomonas sp.]|nr:hypothetical protein [Selenomonas sp.]
MTSFPRASLPTRVSARSESHGASRSLRLEHSRLERSQSPHRLEQSSASNYPAYFPSASPVGSGAAGAGQRT